MIGLSGVNNFERKIYFANWGYVRNMISSIVGLVLFKEKKIANRDLKIINRFKK